MNLTPKERADKAVELLKQCYPQASCSLINQDPLQLLIATRLSAQCTDARVNLVTPELFATFPNAIDYANAPVEKIENIIKSCGLYKTKARDIKAMCQKLIDDYNSQIPDTVEELIKLPGVGRKTTNLVVGEIYGKPAVVTDTHCIRISNRLGLCDTKDPYKVEKRLVELLDPKESFDFCHRLVHHGRAVCDARKPRCEQCCLKDICPSFAK